MLTEDGQYSRSHGLAKDVLTAQASALGVLLLTQNTSWADYEDNFIKQLIKMKSHGITVGVFGDIDIEEHRTWVKNVCQKTGIEPYLPLWQKQRQNIINELLSSGFKAMITTVNAEKLAKKYLGRILDKDLIKEFEAIGIDICGENGEYHTFVIDGPIFSQPLNLTPKKAMLNSGYWVLNLELSE